MNLEKDLDNIVFLDSVDNNIITLNDSADKK